MKCKEEDFANFLYGLNEKKKNITKSEFLFAYEIANKHCLTTKIIQPIFEIEDALSIAFRFEKGNYYRGSIFENSKVSDRKLDETRKDIMSKKYDSMTDLFRMVIKYLLSKIDGIDIQELLKIDNSEDLEQKLNEINNSNKDMETTIECFRKCQKIGSLFDKIIQIQNKKVKELSIEDLIIFKDVNNKDFSLLKQIKLDKDIHPFLKFFIINNQELIKILINKILKQSYIEQLYNKEIDYIPFWIYLLRNMSSVNCILYGEKNNIFYEELTKAIRTSLQFAIKDKTLSDNNWINLIMDNIPQEILNSNLHSFYYFFNKLTDKLDNSLENKYPIIYKGILKQFKQFYINVFNETVNGNIINLLSQDIFSGNFILNFIKDPIESILNNLKKEYSDKIIEIGNINGIKKINEKINSILANEK